MTEKKLSRRDAIKLLGSAVGATTLANIPSKWSKPQLTGGVLPAHAQISRRRPPHRTFDCSTPAVTLVNVTFDNQSSNPVDVYWLDYDCNAVFYYYLDIGLSFQQSTYLGHIWDIVDTVTNLVVLEVTITTDGQVITIT